MKCKYITYELNGVRHETEVIGSVYISRLNKYAVMTEDRCFITCTPEKTKCERYSANGIEKIKVLEYSI